MILKKWLFIVNKKNHVFLDEINKIVAFDGKTICGIEVKKDTKCHCGENCECNKNKSETKDDKCVVKTRLSVELFEIF